MKIEEEDGEEGSASDDNEGSRREDRYKFLDVNEDVNITHPIPASCIRFSPPLVCSTRPF